MKSLKSGTPSHGNGVGSKVRKHEVNLPKNGVLRFQVALLLVLVTVYGGLQLSFEVAAAAPDRSLGLPEEVLEYTMGEVTPEEKKIPGSVKENRVTKVSEPETFEVIDDSSKEQETQIAAPEVDTPVLRVEDVPEVEPDLEPVHVNVVEFAPVFPGCDAGMGNSALISCMNEQMNVYIQKYFDTGIASDYGLSGRQRISVQFTIDADGGVTDVKVRAPHPALEQEVRRVVGRFPQMEPGRQGLQPVKVIFRKPIIFDVH